jgi:peptide/nickel transport system substrate-binding protein
MSIFSNKSAMTRRGLGAMTAALAASIAFMPMTLAQATTTADLAMVGEPQSLDPMATTADLVGTIMQHVYEPLYTFDANWATQPMLAETQPEISADGLTYTIPLRKGVTLHNGRELDSGDVVASLERWLAMTPRGKGLAGSIESLTATDAHTVEIKLNTVQPALISHLALPSGFAAIMAKESIADELTEFVGTGPYKFQERRPDQFVVLVKHDGYTSRTEEPSGYAGARTAEIDELRFIPVPNANTRVEGAIAGQYQFADQLPVESFNKVETAAGVNTVLTMPFGFPYFPTNTKEGPMADLKVRQAFQKALNLEDLMFVAYGDPKFFELAGNHFPAGTPFHSEAGIENYNTADTEGAKALLAESSYDGSPIRILNSKQYDFHHRMALLMAEQLKAAGFAVQLDVVDWATLVQRRADSTVWDVYITHSAFLPEPMLSPPQLGNDAPGWWSTDAKAAALGAFNAETDPTKRGALWADVQQVVYDEVPYIRAGNFAALAAASEKMEGFTPMPWPSFWNVSLND